MTRLNQTITRWQGMGLIATTLLGTGVFILPQLTLAAAGSQAMWAWAMLLIAVLPLTYVFAELGRHYTHAAGPAYFTERAFGPIAGRVAGLTFLFAIPPGITAALIMTFEFLRPLIELSSGQRLLVELAAFVGLFLLNRRGLQLSGKIQLILTLTIVAVVLTMLLAAFTTPHASLSTQAAQQINATSSTSEGLMAAIALAVWSFLGIEAVTHLAGEFKDVKRDFIPAALGGVTLVGLIYIACTWLSSFAPEHSLAMVGAFELLIGDSGRWIIGLLGLVSGLATVNVYFASTARLAWSFSQDGVLPARLNRLNKHQVPSSALLTFILISATILVISHFSQLDFVVLAHWVNGCFVMIYTLSMLAAWKLLTKRHRPAIAIGLVACALFVISLGGAMVYAMILAAVIVPLLYLQQGWKNRNLVSLSK